MGIRLQGALAHFAGECMRAGRMPEGMTVNQERAYDLLRAAGLVSRFGAELESGLYEQAIMDGVLAVHCTFRHDGTWPAFAVYAAVVPGGPVSTGEALARLKECVGIMLVAGRLRVKHMASGDYEVIAG